MSFRSLSQLMLLSIALGLAGCVATAGEPVGASEIRKATIEQILPAQLESTHTAGLGAVVGGLGGFGIGSLIGRGSGRDVARVIGALGGGLVGAEQQERYDRPVPGQQVIVRTGAGVLVSVVQPINPSLLPGQRVYLEGSGQSARVIPQ